VAAPAPTAGPWPQGRIFIAADFDLIDALATALAPAIQPVEGHWSKTFKLGFVRSTLRADYSATLTGLHLQPVPDHPEQVRGTAVVNTNVRCYAKNLGSVSGKGTTTVGVTGSAVFLDGGTLAIQLLGLDEFRVKVDFHNVPPWLDRNIGDFVTALSVLLRDQLSGALRAQRPIQLGHLPAFPLTIGDTTVRIGVKEPTISAIIAPDGRTLLAAAGVPDVQPVP
jgi:hypothetical protein